MNYPHQNGFGGNGYIYYNNYPPPHGQQPYAPYFCDYNAYRNDNIYSAYRRDPRSSEIQRPAGALLPPPMAHANQQVSHAIPPQVQPTRVPAHSGSSIGTTSNQRIIINQSNSTSQPNSNNDKSKNIPKLRNLHKLNKNERKSHRKGFQNKYSTLPFEELLKIKDDLLSQIKDMRDERERKSREIKEVDTVMSFCHIYIEDIRLAISGYAAKNSSDSRDTTRRAASLEAEQRIREVIEKKNNEQRLRQFQRQQQQQHQQQNNQNTNSRKRARIDSPPQRNSSNSSGTSSSSGHSNNSSSSSSSSHSNSTSTSSSSGRSNSSSSSSNSSGSTSTQVAMNGRTQSQAQNKDDNLLKRAQNHPLSNHTNSQILSQHTNGVSASPSSTVHSTTSSSSPLPPYPRDGGETNFKFVNFLLKFSVLSVIVKARLDVLKSSDKNKVKFRLTPQQLEYLQDYKDDKNNASNNHRLLLRMSKPHANQREYYDLIETKIKVKVNGKTPLYPGEKKHSSNNPNQPKPKKPEVIEAPLDISDECTDEVDNEIIFEVDPGTTVNVVIGVYFVRLLSLPESIRAFTEFRQTRSDEFGRQCIQNLLTNPDSGFIDDTLPVSLTCQISKQRIGIPCVGAYCTHFMCFDLVSFLQIHMKTYLWKCPICDKVINSGHIVHDGLFYHLLKNTNDKCLKVQFDKYGNWVPVEEKESEMELDSTEEVCLVSDED